ncbi:MAG TPA: hypothetical protein VMS12_01025 [Thermoanaerobaculia bacterium]|nr:hypothetical protein [Thermoanaerobaculia bacterium]
MKQPGAGLPTGSAGRTGTLSIIALGRIESSSIEALQKFFPVIEQVDSGLSPDAALHAHKGAGNRAIDSCSHDWILILREREIVTPSLAGELAAAASESPRAWGFRLVSQLYYCGRPLRIGRSMGEVRFFHRRHSRFDLRTEGLEIRVQGTVIRLRGAIERRTFASPADHLSHLQAGGVPHSLVRRLLIFIHNAVVTGSLWRSAATLRYLWIEAGYDKDEKTAMPGIR